MEKLYNVKLINGNIQLIYTYTIPTIIICSLLSYKLHEHVMVEIFSRCIYNFLLKASACTMHKNTQ